MTHVSDLVSRIERRARRIRGAVWAAAAWTGAAGGAFALSLAAHLSRRPLGVSLLVAVVCSAPLAALVAYALGRRARPALSALLLLVDERLGLEARLSSLYELSLRPALPFLVDRISRDVETRNPRIARALPVGRAPVLAACLGAALLTAGVAIANTPAPLSSEPAAATPSPAATIDGPVSREDGASTASNLSSDETDSGSPGGSSSSAARAQQTLRDILTELRAPGATPGVAGDSSATATTTVIPSRSEPPDSALRQELEQLRSRLEHDASPLSPSEAQVLRDYVRSTAPAQASTVEDFLAASDVDALRQTITQLLGPDSAASESEQPSDSTVSRLAPDTSPRSSEEGAPSTQPGRAETPSRPASGTLGDGAESDGSLPAEGTEPVFDPDSTEFTPVAPPSVLGASGGYSEYVTLGVPVEPEPGGAVATEGTLDFKRIDSVLSTRDLPDGAAETIRTYFVRITEDEP